MKRPGSSSWQYREAVPADVEAILVARTGKRPSDAMKSLRTTDKREAERRVVAVRARQHEVWDEIRSSSARVPNIPTPNAMIEAVTAHVHKGFLRVQREKLRAELAEEGVDLSLLAAKKRRKRAEVALMPSPNDIGEMEHLAAAVARKEGWSVAPGNGVQGERWNELVALVTKTVQLARSDLADLMDGKDANTDHRAVVERLGGCRPSTTVAPPDEDIMSLFDQYERERLREGKRADTLTSERKTIKHFARFVGEQITVSAISRSHIRDFKRALSEVPHRWTARDELKGMALADAARTWAATGGETRSARTVNREVSEVSAFIAWLKKNDYVEENVATGFRTRIDKAKRKYPPYSDIQLKELFSSPLFVGCHAKKEHQSGDEKIRDWRFWLPLCALYSGARAGEIVQLETNDIRQIEDVWVFDFNDEGASIDKKLKTASSRRIVPIHPALIELGFLDYVRLQVRTGSQRVFSDLLPGPRGDWSYRPSKFWARYLERIDMKRPGLNLHSFRHSFADECRRAGVEEGVLKALLGHADHSQTGHYGTLALGNLRQRHEAIKMVSYGHLHVTRRV
ncbi:site-specific integrase [Alteriqipengyuania sp. WL0013]|uniref:site-specific integrase n=1 Tax=Alteriqipengyuania sp. WL0013 TaxID=3110773 RepID=UPI002BE82C16|nr:site-specific integrase [Alteriqipengyuania sp. WL0013]MEB3415137.1 site-specific integrase [Alteriqipengyuania sp. WL0013]